MVSYDKRNEKMKNDEDDFFDVLCQLSDTVIKIEEVDPEKEYRMNVFKLSKKNMDNFFTQVNQKLSLCKDEYEILFTKEVTLNFLIASLKKILVDYDCPDENMEYMANNIRDEIISCTRREFEKNKVNND